MLFWRAWTHLGPVLIQMLHELQLNFHKVCKRKSGTPGFMPHLLNPLGLHTDCYRYSATFKHKFKMCITHNTVCEIQDQRMDRQENQKTRQCDDVETDSTRTSELFSLRDSGSMHPTDY